MRKTENTAPEKHEKRVVGVEWETIDQVLECAEDAQKVAEAAVAWRVAKQEGAGDKAKDLLTTLCIEIDSYWLKWHRH